MTNITTNDTENPSGLSCEDFKFLNNLIESLPTNSQHDVPQNETQKEPNDDYLPTSPDNSMNGMPNSPIRFQKENESYNALELCLPTSSGFPYITGTPNEVVAPNNFQDIESSIHNRNMIPDKDKINYYLPPIEPDKMREEERNEEKPRMKKRMKQTMNKAERVRKRRYRSTERQLYNKLRDLFPSDSTKTKHQLITKAIEELQNRRILRFCESCENRLRE